MICNKCGRKEQYCSCVKDGCNSCTPKNNPCCGEDNPYCADDIDCLGIKKGQYSSDVIRSMGLILCDLRNRVGELEATRIEFKEPTDCNNGVIIQVISTPTDTVLEEYSLCSDLKIGVDDNPSCSNGGFIIQDISGTSPVNIYEGCYTDITFEENTECTDGCGFIVKQNGTIIKSFCCEYLQFETNECGGFTVTNPNNNSTFGYCPPVPSSHQNTLYVDDTYGNDATGERENVNKPFKTIEHAYEVAAVSGDTVHVRNGSYTMYEDGSTGYCLVLRDNINLHFENVTVNAYGHFIGDNRDKVACDITGNLFVEGKGNSFSFEIFGNGSNVNIKMKGISGNNTYYNVNNDASEKSVVNIEVETLEGLELDYAVKVGGNTDVNVNVRKHLICKESVDTAFGTSVIHISPSYSTTESEVYEGNLNFKCPYVYIGNNIQTSNGGFNSNSNGSFFNDIYIKAKTDIAGKRVGGNIYIEVDRLLSEQELLDYNDQFLINKKGETHTIFKFGEIQCKQNGIQSNVPIKGSSAEVNPYSYMYFEGVIKSEGQVLQYDSRGHSIFKNSVLEGGLCKRKDDSNNLLLFGTVNIGIAIAQEGFGSYYNVSFIDTSIIYNTTDSDGTAPTAVTLSKGSNLSNNSNILFRNVGIYDNNPNHSSMNSVSEAYSSTPQVQMTSVISNLLFDTNVQNLLSSSPYSFYQDPNYKPTELF